MKYALCNDMKVYVLYVLPENVEPVDVPPGEKVAAPPPELSPVPRTLPNPDPLNEAPPVLSTLPGQGE